MNMPEAGRRAEGSGEHAGSRQEGGEHAGGRQEGGDFGEHAGSCRAWQEGSAGHGIGQVRQRDADRDTMGRERTVHPRADRPADGGKRESS